VSKSPIPANLSLVNLRRRLIKEQKRNESAAYHIIGLTLETRPDYINEEEVVRMRELGCTRVELGVQALDDTILALNKRGHGVREIADATRLLRQYGFKITYHMMPALPGSNPKKDFEMFKILFTDERFQPDQIKFYPTVVIKGSLLYRWYKQGKYEPYSDKELRDLIIRCKSVVPYYVRIIRLIRDIPGESIVAGNKITNLRQIMKQQGIKCNCIRCREVGGTDIVSDINLYIEHYLASGGIEYFISLENSNRSRIYGFCRLRIDNSSSISPAIIRELHVYGQLAPVGSNGQIQHRGLGKRLVSEAERIARLSGAVKVAIISGVGVRGYYRKLGYCLRKTYLIKILTKTRH
jgi:elongator complex protein 3